MYTMGYTKCKGLMLFSVSDFKIDSLHAVIVSA